LTGPGRLLLGPAHRDDDVQNTAAPKAKPEHQEKGHSGHALSSVAASRGIPARRSHFGGKLLPVPKQGREWRRPRLLGCERVGMSERQTAPYGSWSSPITSDLIVASTIGLGGIQLDGADVYWLESRPRENGRSVIVCRAADGSSVDITPPVAGEGSFNVRTRVHEYG